MRAVLLPEFGPAENMKYVVVPTPEPAEGQLRVDVKAIAVQLIEARIRAGVSPAGRPLPDLPYIPGGSVAGVVDAVGPGVDESWLDTRVAAGIDNGGYAEYAVAATERTWALPEHVDYAESTVMLSTGPTALAILELAALTADDVVLITAAAGGIGTLLTQSAERLGATVVGLASGSKTTKVRADIVVDYTAPDWTGLLRTELAGRAPTVVLDGVGGSTAQQAYELLDRNGRIVSFGAASGDFGRPPREDIAFQSLFESELMATLIDPVGRGALIAQALDATAAGELAPRVQPYPLADAADAHEALEARRTAGQVVLIP